MQVEHGTFVAGEDAVVLTGAVGVPEHYAAIHGGRGYVLTRGIEACGEDFAGVAWDLSTWELAGSQEERLTGELHDGSL